MSMRQQRYNKQNPKLVQKEVTTQPPTMSKFGSNGPSCFRVEDHLHTFPKGSYVKLCTAVVAILDGGHTSSNWPSCFRGED